MALDRNELVDIGWKNQKFTSLNRHEGDTFTKERLDRVDANKKWLHVLDNLSVDVLTMGCFDHCPSFLNIVDHDGGLIKRRIFRYEAKRVLEEDGE